MNKQLTFSFIGGDKRQLSIISQLSEEGYSLRVVGLPIGHCNHNIYISDSVADCQEGSDVIVLPIPYSDNYKSPAQERTVNAPYFSQPIYAKDVIKNLKPSALVFAGKVDNAFAELLKTSGHLFFDYAQREELAVLNAVPTAEGAIEVAMTNTEHTIHGSNCLVIGYGRIGKILAADLKSLGANVTVSARSHKDIAWISANGLLPTLTKDISQSADTYDIIFNTVPHMVLDFKTLSKTRPGVLIIDLASSPGGVDTEVAENLKRRVIPALSLPGKVAPCTAGMIIKNTIINILEELEVY